MGSSKDNEILTSLHGRKIGVTSRGALVIDGQQASQEVNVGGLWALCPSTGQDPAGVYEFFDDFIYSESATVSGLSTYVSTDDSGTGTNAYQDAAGGIFNVVTAAADNDYHAMSTTQETFKFAAGKRLWLEARVKVAEATTDESTWWVGLTDTLTTGGMQANDAGPLASYDGALFYKSPETGMGIDFETSNAGTQVTSTDLATSVTDEWTRVGFYFDGAATTSTITPFVAVEGSNVWTKGTAHSITLSGLEEMHLVFGIKAGPSGGAETLQIDYIKVVAER
jgi:hypothetical protein